jgi:hypothetical protein
MLSVLMGWSGGRATKSDSHNLHAVSPGDLVRGTAGNVGDALDGLLYPKHSLFILNLVLLCPC